MNADERCPKCGAVLVCGAGCECPNGCEVCPDCGEVLLQSGEVLCASCAEYLALCEADEEAEHEEDEREARRAACVHRFDSRENLDGGWCVKCGQRRDDLEARRGW